MEYPLACHPDSPCGADIALAVSVRREGADSLLLRYRLTGAVDALAIPPLQPPERRDGLWQATCFEAFVRPQGADQFVRPQGAGHYAEFNFAPSRGWAAYGFDDYRAGMADLALDPPVLFVEQGAGRLDLMALVRLAAFADAPVWQLGLSAVVEEKSGAKSYWALRHPAGKPDFHHGDCFAAQVGAAKGA